MGNSASAPAVAWQPSLWANRGTGVDVSYCGLQRLQLDADSWVDHCPGWTSGSDHAFEELLRDVAWSQRRRWMYDRQVDEPRLTSWQKSDQQSEVTYKWLEEARASLSARYGVRFDSVGINLYRDGADSVAWHRDRIPPEIVDPVVALVSLGEPRTGRPARDRWPDTAPLRAQRPEGEGSGSAHERRVATRGWLTQL
jgi:alkylated DNA repair dioxygenase AlkB